ncbi:MAG: ABC transporter ATP-binding protein [Syntrophobacterales bacterium]|nr:ABC transporter ATP-binding protein [Syntrophobacterales bacterium]
MAALLEIQDLTHHFGGLCALSGFSLTLAAGELVGLIGPNGAGKTTVFNLITGVYRPTSGSIRFLGEEITAWPSHRITAAGIARTFQNIRLFKEMSALDNVRLGAFARHDYSLLEALGRRGRFRAEERRWREEAWALLQRLHLAHYAHTPARNLPYGEQRRLEIARALISRPRLLLLDEPAAGMNEAETEALMALIREIQAEYHLTILLIEHQMRVVMGLCRRITVLDFGVIIAAGPPEEIRDHPRVLEAYLGREEPLVAEGGDGRP